MKYRKYTFNQNFVDIIDTPEKAYFLGWAFSDGYHHEKSYSFRLALQERDVDVLHLLTTLLESTYPIRHLEKQKLNHQNQKYLTLCGKTFSQSLTKMGVVQNKSLNLQIPIEKIPPHLVKFLLRGWFEGDGHLSFKVKENMKISAAFNIPSASKICVQQLKSLIETYSGEEIKLYHYGKYYRLAFSSARNIYRFISWLYSDRKDLCLTRKLETVSGFLNSYKEIFENGRDINPQKVTVDQRELIIKEREKGLSIKRISNLTGKSPSVVLNQIKNLPNYSSMVRKYTFDKYSFEDFSKNKNSYLLGYSLSKASLRKENSLFSIADIDKRKIDNLQILFENERPICKIGDCHRVVFSEKLFFQKLLQLGFSTDGIKNHHFNIEGLSDQSMRYLLMGLFEARGGIVFRKDRKEAALTLGIPQKWLAILIQQYITKMTGIRMNLSERGMPTLKTTGTNSPVQVLKFLFQNGNELNMVFWEKCFYHSHSFLSSSLP